ncbi:hypothetical protein QAD02_018496 [Eretmocerus hayati]|uniref:Uncharacterized protein n=1 Tax=Eretmocerus hayati TaxID=131215 RepID=A0ACC2PGJ7_9HYME|nr:hypothetical protein QAD02_018496 [Eretmocerus hayati]
MAKPWLLNFCWIIVLCLQGLTYPLEALPIHPTQESPDSDETLRHFEQHWIKYAVGLLTVTVTAFTLVGCLCCRRNSRSKGFQEFKDGISIDNEQAAPQLHGLELQVPIGPDRVQFDPLPADHFSPESACSSPRLKALSNGIAPFAVPDEDSESELSTLKDSCHEWFANTELHVPREKLKYLREIGHGWFGKVVEGYADLQGIGFAKGNARNGNVVVRILTEEATAKEKAWFLGEATLYFKLRHRNILSLYGSCLETDPYLLLFESCPLGNLKAFLRGNRDPQTRAALIKQNMPTRIAIEIGAGLRHMHEHGLAHTDLAARNCLVASDLSIKLGDYGTSVEKYPEDYYVLGDRALPIRWSAPETIECTETTIETREITARANLWSYAVLMWEIATWGERPYNELEDEKVIEMLLSSKTGKKEVGSQILLQNSENCASNLLEAIKTCLILEPEKRLPLERVRHVLLKEQLEAECSDFDQRWISMRPNNIREPTRSASLQDLRGSLDSEQWSIITQTSFRLGPEEPVKNVPYGRSRLPFGDTDSETEEESWRGRVERGAYTEKVKQKSKSVADLMILVHIEPDSDADLSLGPQIPMVEKRKRLPTTGSDSDLPSAVFDDQFDLALRNLRDPLVPGNSLRGLKSLNSNSIERPKLLDLSSSPNRTNSPRRFFDSKTEVKEASDKTTVQLLTKESPQGASTESNRKLISRYESLQNSSPNNKSTKSEVNVQSQISTAVKDERLESPYLSRNVQVTDLDEIEVVALKDNKHNVKNHLIDVNSWSSALEAALEHKGEDPSVYATPSPVHIIESSNDEKITPSPQSRAEYSAEDNEDELSNAEDLPGLSKRNLPMDEEDDRKRMSTPDDERSSDSGFRDKESCEEEESPLPGPLPNLTASQSNTPKSTHDSAEEEQMRVLYELDTILDAECYGTLNDSLDPNLDHLLVQESNKSSQKIPTENLEIETETSEVVITPSSETAGETIREVLQTDKSSSDDANLTIIESAVDSQPIMPVDPAHRAALAEDDPINCPSQPESSSWPCLMALGDNDDEDSSTMSMRSDNSYVSFGMDEEFVTAIRNELKEKLPHAQMSVVEVQEPQDEDEPSIASDFDNKNWDDEAEEELADRTGIIDISIRYNTFGTPLSPILEERESAGNSESTNVTRTDSQDASITSKGGSNSLSEDDVLFIDTRTNQATLIQGVSSHPEESQGMSNYNATAGGNQLNLVKHCNQQVENLDTPNTSHDNVIASGTGAPLPSPEDEGCKWQQQITGFPTLDNLISSSGEFVWQQYGAAHKEVLPEYKSPTKKKEVEKSQENREAQKAKEDGEGSEEDYGSDEEDEEEFTPSAWDANLAPHRSALRSPDKSLRSGDQKKSVCFKKQRYQCVYEYPKETPPENQSPTVSSWKPTSYTDWEEMIDNCDRFNFRPTDYFDTSNTRNDEEFFVSSSNRPFQFQSGSGKYVSQFFPGASGSGTDATSEEAPSQESSLSEVKTSPQQQQTVDRQQLGLDEAAQVETNAESLKNFEIEIPKTPIQPSVKTSPSDGQCSNDNPKSTSNRDDLDVE